MYACPAQEGGVLDPKKQLSGADAASSSGMAKAVKQQMSGTKKATKKGKGAKTGDDNKTKEANLLKPRYPTSPQPQ